VCVITPKQNNFNELTKCKHRTLSTEALESSADDFLMTLVETSVTGGAALSKAAAYPVIEFDISFGITLSSPPMGSVDAPIGVDPTSPGKCSSTSGGGGDEEVEGIFFESLL
jgi:hypothetical protein